jgi:hypothetical protein
MQPTPLALPQPGRDFGSVPLPSLISPHTAASAAAEQEARRRDNVIKQRRSHARRRVQQGAGAVEESR